MIDVDFYKEIIEDIEKLEDMVINDAEGDWQEEEPDYVLVDNKHREEVDKIIDKIDKYIKENPEDNEISSIKYSLERGIEQINEREDYDRYYFVSWVLDFMKNNMEDLIQREINKVTVRDLRDRLNELIEKGHGDKKVERWGERGEFPVDISYSEYSDVYTV